MSSFISLVTLVVPDYDEAIEFYVGKLGFSLLEDRQLPDGKRWVRVAPEGTQTGLLLAKAADAEQQRVIGNQAGGRVGLFLQSDDFWNDHESFTARGVRFLETPRDEEYGIVAVFVDPFGNKWDLIELRSAS